MSRRLVLAALLGLLGSPVAAADGTKTVSGKIRTVEEKRLVLKRSGLFSDSLFELELTENTKKIGQVTPGMHAKVKYREEKSPDGTVRRIALEIETRPAFASKDAKKLAKEKKSPEDPEPPPRP